MYIASSTYLKPIEEVEKYLPAHRAFLDKYYEAGVFICSGVKKPRTGGVMLFNASDEAEMKRIIAEDPFSINGVSAYEITEFTPSKSAPAFKAFVV